MTIIRFILRLLFRGCITEPHDPVAESCAHEPLLELDGKKIVGSHRCKHCGLNKSYWNAREL